MKFEKLLSITQSANRPLSVHSSLPRPLSKHQLAIHSKALQCAHEFKKAENNLLEILEQVSKQKIYLFLGYPSLFTYGVECLKLSENVAYNLTKVMLTCQKIPALKKALHDGSLTLSKARKISSVITQANSSLWIAKAKELSQKNLEKAVATVNPQILTPEKTRYVSEKRVLLQMGVSEKIMQDFRRVQDLASQSLSRTASLEDSLELIIQFYLKHKDPLQKARRVLVKKSSSESSPQSSSRSSFEPKPQPPLQETRQKFSSSRLETVRLKNSQTHECKHAQARSINPLASSQAHKSKHVVRSTHSKINFQSHNKRHKHKRSPLPALTKHFIYQKYSNGCAYKLCHSKRWLDIHHIIPLNEGGTNNPENLILLCQKHHRLLHEK